MTRKRPTSIDLAMDSPMLSRSESRPNSPAEDPPMFIPEAYHSTDRMANGLVDVYHVEGREVSTEVDAEEEEVMLSSGGLIGLIGTMHNDENEIINCDIEAALQEWGALEMEEAELERKKKEANSTGSVLTMGGLSSISSTVRVPHNAINPLYKLYLMAFKAQFITKPRREIRYVPYSAIPVSSLAIFISIVGVFIWGVQLFNSGSVSAGDGETWSTHITPDRENLFFYMNKPYPECTSQRDEPVRLITYLFVHGSMNHLVGNILTLLIYGTFVEAYIPFGWLLVPLIFFGTGMIGAIGYGVLFPWKGLIGASPAVYGLGGASLVLGLFGKDRLPTFWGAFVPIMVVLHVLSEAVIFETMFNDKTGHASHLFGFFSGLSVMLLCSPLLSKNRAWYHWAAMIVGATLLALIVALCTIEYTRDGIPKPYVKPYLHNEESAYGCCYQAYQYQAEHPQYSLNQITSASFCINNEMYYAL